MRINKYIAKATGLSRRAADKLVIDQQVRVNDVLVAEGYEVKQHDKVELNGKILEPRHQLTIMMNKPVGFVCSRKGQGSHTIYELLPEKYQQLKSVGRLDKDSSGLIILTNDGDLANKLTHPSFSKRKTYVISLDRPLEPLHQQMISDNGIMLDDGPSRLLLRNLSDRKEWEVIMSEGRNRQIRRTFESLGYKVITLHRTAFADYQIGDLAAAQIKEL